MNIECIWVIRHRMHYIIYQYHHTSPGFCHEQKKCSVGSSLTRPWGGCGTLPVLRISPFLYSKHRNVQSLTARMHSVQIHTETNSRESTRRRNCPLNIFIMLIVVLIYLNRKSTWLADTKCVSWALNPSTMHCQLGLHSALRCGS